MKRVLATTAALGAAVVASALLSLPPEPISLSSSWDDRSVAGLLHIHTNRSDGRGTPEQIAESAARAGLKFVVFADHGDGTRTPEAPTYRSGVLCLDSVEISTTGGHYIALDMKPSPYPLSGEPREVVEDVRRLGGFGIAAHPDSPKTELSWHAWDAAIDAIEIVNPDTSWRVHAFERGWRARLTLFFAALAYPVRPGEAIGTLLTDSPVLRSQWNELARNRRVVGISGADAHGKLELWSADPADGRYSLPMPSYESAFEALSVHVVPESPLTGDAALDGARLMDGIRAGRLYTAINAWAHPPAFEFSASHGRATVRSGEEFTPSAPVSLHVRSNAPAEFVTTVWRGNEPLDATLVDGVLDLPIPADPAVYRVEVRSPAHSQGPAWITSNPIYIRSTSAPMPPPAPRAVTGKLSLFDGRTTAGWEQEASGTSLAAIDVVPQAMGFVLRLRYGLAGGSPTGQYAGAAVATPSGIPPHDRVTLTLRGERPMRVSIQARARQEGLPAERWQRSIYVDATEREHTVFFDEMVPVGHTSTPRPPTNYLRNILLVVDTTNSKPGASGRLWIRDIRLER